MIHKGFGVKTTYVTIMIELKVRKSGQMKDRKRNRRTKLEVRLPLGFPGGSVVKNLPAVQETWV